MFGAKDKPQVTKPQNRIDCLIGAGTRVDGNIIFSGGLRVDGQVRVFENGVRTPKLTQTLNIS